MADKLWILVGNASRVRLFSANERGEDWDLLEEFRHDESRAHNMELQEQRDNPNAGTLGPAPENEPRTASATSLCRVSRTARQRASLPSKLEYTAPLEKPASSATRSSEVAA